MFKNSGNGELVWYKEGGLTLLTGTLFGATSVLVGHPFDTIKTKMQAQASHMVSEQSKPKYLETVYRVVNSEGITGLYRGWAPPFCGSVLFRSLQFSIYQMVHTKCNEYE